MSLSLRVWSEGKPKETTHSRPARLAPRFPGAGKSVARIGKNVTPVGDMGRNQKTQNVGVCNKKRGPAWLHSDFTSKPTKRGFWGGWSLGNPQICPKRYKERHRAYRSGVMVVAYRCATNIGSVRKLAYLYVLRKFGDNPLHSPLKPPYYLNYWTSHLKVMLTRKAHHVCPIKKSGKGQPFAQLWDSLPSPAPLSLLRSCWPPSGDLCLRKGSNCSPKQVVEAHRLHKRFHPAVPFPIAGP